jgi:hypothetical protein
MMLKGSGFTICTSLGVGSRAPVLEIQMEGEIPTQTGKRELDPKLADAWLKLHGP